MNYRPRAAFTLIEVIVAVAISTIVLLALAQLIPYFYKANASVTLEWQAVESDRSNIENAALLLRSATALTSAEPSALTFDAIVDGTTSPVSYTLDNGTLESEIPDSPTAQAIAAYVANSNMMPVFTYYDASGTELTDPVDPAQVTYVGISATIDADPSAMPVGTTLLSGAALRNLPPL